MFLVKKSLTFVRLFFMLKFIDLNKDFYYSINMSSIK